MRQTLLKTLCAAVVLCLLAAVPVSAGGWLVYHQAFTLELQMSGAAPASEVDDEPDGTQMAEPPGGQAEASEVPPPNDETHVEEGEVDTEELPDDTDTGPTLPDEPEAKHDALQGEEGGQP